MSMVIPREIIEKVCEKFDHTVLIFDPEGKITKKTCTLSYQQGDSKHLVERFFTIGKDGFYCVAVYSHEQKTACTPAGLATYRLRVQNGKITDTEYGGSVGFIDWMKQATN